jgi:hypothetical protein
MATQKEINEFKEKLPLLAEMLTNATGEKIDFETNSYWGSLTTKDNYEVLFRFDYKEVYAKFNHRGYEASMKKCLFTNADEICISAVYVLEDARKKVKARSKAYSNYFNATGCID